MEPGEYALNPGNPGDYDNLFKTLAEAGKTPDNIAHPIQLGVVTGNMQYVTGEEELYPEKAAILGPVKIIPLEYANITCRSIDIIEPATELEIGLARLWREVFNLEKVGVNHNFFEMASILEQLPAGVEIEDIYPASPLQLHQAPLCLCVLVANIMAAK